MHIHNPPNMLFHSSIKKLQQDPDRGRDKDGDLSSSKPSTETPPSPTDPDTQSNQSQTLTDSEMELLHPNFSKLNVDDKLETIQSMKTFIAKKLDEKNDPECEPWKCKVAMKRLSLKEKQIRDADTWYKKAFRSIAWGPTILLSLFL